MLDTVTGIDTLDEVTAALDEFWSAHEGLPEHVRMRVGTAVGEIAANIIEHAGKGEAVRLRMEIQRLPHEVVVDFTDDGVPVDVDLAAVRMPDVLAERGRGLALAQSVLRKLSYRRAGVVNHWTLASERFS